ncbi:MAG: DUF1624 domain-containing protein [Aquabacterium sp.]|uniref:DUF1624 domain-containing protein n=1 Tax=Aquabacterium sp. TaxID=1872578 RepID=UPI0011FEF284|nr:heparan-alpha-glucosaminide N-acetyltransferase [Aquabacterium sp.]TAK87362.1 MAG: DUF1624 domain-containing protein [Aquabacterium sp.]
MPRGRVASGASRYDRLDALRGFALIWMAFFHFCFDLSNYRLLDANFYSDALWTNQRTCILSLFLLCAGAGQAVATSQGQSWQRFWRRWAQVVGCAALVSLGSWFMFPNSFIYFGVLHGMAVMLIIARLTAPLRAWLWPMGLLAIALPRLVAEPFFDSRLTNWVGLVTHKPITEDYVPILPWLGVMWWGLAATQWILAHRPGLLSWAIASSQGKALDSGDNGDLVAPMRQLRQSLAWLGRWSLTFYMVHQPVLIGGLMAWMTLTGRPIP